MTALKLSSSTVPLEHWLNTTIGSADEIARVAFSLEDGCVVHDHDPGIPKPDACGAYVVLGSEHSEAVRIGIMSTDEGCQALAKSLFGMTLDDEDLPVDDMKDAIQEIGNMMVGLVKSRMSDTVDGLKLGLPEFFCSGPQTGDRETEIATIAGSFGEIPVRLIAVKKPH